MVVKIKMKLINQFFSFILMLQYLKHVYCKFTNAQLFKMKNFSTLGNFVFI